jgi:hypothetical protein
MCEWPCNSYNKEMVSLVANGGSLYLEIKGQGITDAYHSIANDFLKLGGETHMGHYLQNREVGSM